MRWFFKHDYSGAHRTCCFLEHLTGNLSPNRCYMFPCFFYKCMFCENTCSLRVQSFPIRERTGGCVSGSGAHARVAVEVETEWQQLLLFSSPPFPPIPLAAYCRCYSTISLVANFLGSWNRTFQFRSHIPQTFTIYHNANQKNGWGYFRLGKCS